MVERHSAGTWAEIQMMVLAPGERAPQVPQDTQRMPLQMRTKGFLRVPAAVGEEAEIRTAAGRHLRGTLVAVNPAYEHGFGPPIPALLTVGEELRALLHAGEATR